MKNLLVTATLLALSGCATPSFLNGAYTSLNPNYQPPPAAAASGESVSDEEWFRDNASVITKIEREEKADFVKEFCGGKMTATCKSKYNEMVTARIEEQYPEADFAAVSRTCRAHPKACKTPVLMEYQVHLNHSESLSQARAVASAREQAATRERKRQFWKNWANEMDRQRERNERQEAVAESKKVSCTSSRQFNGDVNTNCH